MLIERRDNLMRVRRLNEEQSEMEQELGSNGVTAIEIVLKRTDLEAFSSRLLRIKPGGYTAYHDHSREHVVIVIGGLCKVETNNQIQDLGETHAITIQSGVPHKFYNPGPKRLELLIMNFYLQEQKPIEAPTSITQISEPMSTPIVPQPITHTIEPKSKDKYGDKSNY